VTESDLESPGDGSNEHPAQCCDPRIRRRIEPRHDVDTEAVIRLVNLGADVHGRILDISMGGCRICTDVRFPLGIFRRVETEFRIEGLPFRLPGVIQAIYDPFNVGIRFLDMSERKREQLQHLIDDIKAAHNEADKRAGAEKKRANSESTPAS